METQNPVMQNISKRQYKYTLKNANQFPNILQAQKKGKPENLATFLRS